MGKRITVLLAVIGLLLVFGTALGEEITDTQGDMPVAENEHFSLHLNYQKGETLQFYVTDKRSGFVYHSSPADWEESSDRKKRMQTGSQLIVNSLDKVSKAAYTANSQVSSVGEEGTVVTLVPGGFRVDYDFPRAKDMYRVPVVYTLEPEGLRVEVLMTEIEEYGDVYVQSVAVLPNFFGAASDAQGYLLIPDGCGALIDFQSYRKGMSGYRQSLYGRDPALTSLQQVGQAMTASLPVLGIQNDDAGVLMIAAQCSALATACAYPAGSDTVYSSAYFEFTYRAVDKMTMADKSWFATDVQMVNEAANDQDNAVVLYRFCSGEESGYTGMAELCRQYLISQGMDQRAGSEASIRLEVYGGVKKERSVLGVMVTDILEMTTFAQARTMLEELSESGVSGLHMTFMGWNKGGLQDSVQSAAEAEKKLGGERGLEQLLSAAQVLQAQVLCDTDLLRFYETDMTHNALFGSAQKVTGEAAEQHVFQVSTYQKNEDMDPHYLLQPGQLSDNAQALLSGLDMPDASFSTLGQLLYSDYRYEDYVSRERMLHIIRQTLRDARQQLDTLAVSCGNAYALPYADAIYDTPIFDSGYDVAATDVPFVSLVLHGSQTLYAPALNLSEDPGTFLLRLIETGVNPTFALTWASSAELRDTRYEHLMSTEYTVQKERILDVWSDWQAASDGLGGLRITGHLIDGELRRTTYEDGTCVFVNYGWTDAAMDGLTVPARQWVVKKGGA